LFRPEPNQKYLNEIQRKVKVYAFPKYRPHETEFETQETVSAFLVVDFYWDSRDKLPVRR